MARHLPKSRKLTRTTGQRAPRTEIYVICEGERTEPECIKAFAKEFRNGLLDVIPIPKGGPIRQLVDRIREKEAELAARARKRRDSFLSYFEVWGVADVDNHPRVQEARNLARELGLKLVVSNPCFELWAILHYRVHDAERTRHEVQQQLHELMPSYHHENNPVLDHQAMFDRYASAKQNAIRINNNRINEENEGGNPSTDTYLLFDSIIKNGSP